MLSDWKLTPTEELVLGTLAGRVRLGHSCWTFSSSTKRQIVSLEDKGLITFKSGSAENTLVVWPTKRFLDDKSWFRDDYAAPRYERLERASRTVLRAAGRFCDVCAGSSAGPHNRSWPCEVGAREILAEVLEELHESH